MYLFSCQECLLSIHVQGGLEELQRLVLQHPWWRGGWPCPLHDCDGMMEYVMDIEVRDQIPHLASKGLIKEYKLTPVEFFRALCGEGMPAELAGCEPEVVTSLLQAHAAVDSACYVTPGDKTVIQWIELENGVRIHFGTSPHGAVVYKITRNSNDGNRKTNTLLQDKSPNNDRGVLHPAAGDDELQGARPSNNGDNAPGEPAGSGGEGAQEGVLPGSGDVRHRVHPERVSPDLETREGDDHQTADAQESHTKEPSRGRAGR